MKKQNPMDFTLPVIVEATRLYEINYRMEGALQSNFRTSILLTDGGKFNPTLLELNAHLKETYPDDAVVAELSAKLTELTLDLTTQMTYTGRLINGVLNAHASMHTQQVRGQTDLIQEAIKKEMQGQD